jgi:broad specificity phosphatase PhoE
MIPNGESLTDFEDRQFAFWDAALKMARSNGLTVYVTHNSVITSLVNLTEDNHDADAVKNDSIKPGGVAEILFDGKKHRIKPVFGIAEPAVYSGS